MKRIRIHVSFEADFEYEFDDQVEIDEWDDQEEIDNIIETLSDRSNRFWNDAEFDIYEIDPTSGQKVEDSPNNW